MKRTLLTIAFVLLISLGGIFLLSSLTIQHPSLEETEQIEILVTDIEVGSSHDIVFRDDGTHRYYINRGLEQGLTIEGLKEKVLNKKVTLRLAKLWVGTSEHISYLAVGDEVLFTEID